jgi:hypothetical protein
MVCLDGRTLKHMAANSDAGERRITGRRLAMLFDALNSSSAAMGEHCSIS